MDREVMISVTVDRMPPSLILSLLYFPVPEILAADKAMLRRSHRMA